MSKSIAFLTICCAAHDHSGAPSIHPAHDGETLREEESRIVEAVTQDVANGLRPEDDMATVREAQEILAVDPGFVQELGEAVEAGETLAAIGGGLTATIGEIVNDDGCGDEEPGDGF